MYTSRPLEVGSDDIDAISEHADSRPGRTRDPACWVAALLAVATSAVVVTIAVLVAIVAPHR
jgi:hypothetical protein